MYFPLGNVPDEKELLRQTIKAFKKLARDTSFGDYLTNFKVNSILGHLKDIENI